MLLRIVVLTAFFAAVAALQGEVLDASQPAERVSREEAIVLAVEGPTEELLGPEPNLQSSFAPEEYQTPWTWWLGVLLTVVAVMMTVGFGLAYYLLIHRPRQRTPQP